MSFSNSKPMSITELVQRTVAKSNKGGVVRLDDSCNIGFKRFLLAHAEWALPVNGFEIIKEVIKFEGSDYDVFCFSNSFQGTFYDMCANKFRAFLEMALSKFPFN